MVNECYPNSQPNEVASYNTVDLLNRLNMKENVVQLMFSVMFGPCEWSMEWFPCLGNYLLCSCELYYETWMESNIASLLSHCALKWRDGKRDEMQKANDRTRSLTIEPELLRECKVHHFPQVYLGYRRKETRLELHGHSQIQSKTRKHWRLLKWAIHYEQRGGSERYSFCCCFSFPALSEISRQPFVVGCCYQVIWGVAKDVDW